MVEKGWSSVWMISSSIRTRRGCCCRWFAIVVTVLSVLLEHMFGLTADSVAHTICGESRAGASTVTTALNGWHSVSPRYVSNRTTMLHYKKYRPYSFTLTKTRAYITSKTHLQKTVHRLKRGSLSIATLLIGSTPSFQ